MATIAAPHSSRFAGSDDPRPVLGPDTDRADLVDLVTGSFGAGHDAAASAIAHQLHQAGVRTRTWDIVDLIPCRLGRILRTGYLRQLQSLPGSWRWVLEQLERRDGAVDVVTRALASSADALLDIAADRPSMIVSTHPLASQILGRLRAQQRLDVPVTTYLTDMSVHRMWIHPSVDRHLAIHAMPAATASALGARGTVIVRPAVDPSFTVSPRDPITLALTRTGLGLPVHRALALVTGGSHGIGQLEQCARDLAATGVVTPVVLCGLNRRLLARIDRGTSMVGLGWVSDMPALLAAVDVVVQNAGGITSLEALATGLPLITYRSIAGHGETNAAVLDAAGLAPWVRESGDLTPSLVHALTCLARAAPLCPSAVDALLNRPARVQ